MLPNPTNGIDTTRFNNKLRCFAANYYVEMTNYYVEMINYYVEMTNFNVEMTNFNVVMTNFNVVITHSNVVICPFIDHERLLFSHVRHSRMHNKS
ncbi:MAG: hypothetical protein LBJ00_06850 [Planctomycetaceae bacterium]|nr:hypothetical protein [Planctomycetaceae bacterium]